MANAIIQKLKPVLKPIRAVYLNTRQSITGAPIRPVNYFHASSRSSVMSLFVPSDVRQSHDPRAEQLRRDGFVSMPGFYDPKLIQEIREQFDRVVTNDALIDKHGYATTVKSSVEIDKYIPKIYDLVRHPEMMKVMHSFYKSYYKLIYISGTRLYPIPEKERTPQNLLSAIWHCDDLPTDLVHLAIYLHDVTLQHGPTALVSRERTKQLMRMGYGDRWNIGIPRDVLEDKNHVKNLASKSGTAHLMLPCLGLHRAGIPDVGLIRDSLFFSFRPGLEPTHIEKLTPVKKQMYGVLKYVGESKHNKQAPIFKDKTIIYAGQ